jgi:hypothetical protein
MSVERGACFMNGIHLSTIDDPELVNLAIETYFNAFESDPIDVSKMRKLAKKKNEVFAIATEIRPIRGRYVDWVIDTQSIRWELITLKDVPRDYYDPTVEVLVYVRMFYGDSAHPQFMHKNKICKI